MKCPKCQYIGYDQSDRCRNCGYDFSLSADLETLDLPIRTGDEPIGPLADFTLGDREEDAGRPPVPPRAGDRSGSAPSRDLPLFRDRRLDDDAPLVSLPATPRAPVAVRKSATVRPVPQRRPADEPALDLEAPDAPVPSRAAARAAQSHVEEPASSTRTAGVGARLLGAGIDIALLAAIDAGVLYSTLLVCNLTLQDVRTIPVVPFLAFLALLNGGYKAAFTAAGGQTLGKMAAGTRVVNADESAWTDRVPLGQSVVRAAVYGMSVLTAGLGFLPVVFSADRRAFHDRLAHTRVVKA